MIIDVQRLSQVKSRVGLQVDLRVHHIIDRDEPHARRALKGQIVRFVDLTAARGDGLEVTHEHVRQHMKT